MEKYTKKDENTGIIEIPQPPLMVEVTIEELLKRKSFHQDEIDKIDVAISEFKKAGVKEQAEQMEAVIEK